MALLEVGKAGGTWVYVQVCILLYPLPAFLLPCFLSIHPHGARQPWTEPSETVTQNKPFPLSWFCQ